DGKPCPTGKAHSGRKAISRHATGSRFLLRTTGRPRFPLSYTLLLGFACKILGFLHTNRARPRILVRERLSPSRWKRLTICFSLPIHLKGAIRDWISSGSSTNSASCPDGAFPGEGRPGHPRFVFTTGKESVMRSKRLSQQQKQEIFHALVLTQ